MLKDMKIPRRIEQLILACGIQPFTWWINPLLGLPFLKEIMMT